METKWTTIRTFSFLPEAQLTRTLLEADGIPVLIPEEHVGAISPMLSTMQIRVQVPTAELTRAREILGDSEILTNPSEELKGWAYFRANFMRGILGVFAGPLPPTYRAKKSKKKSA